MKLAIGTVQFGMRYGVANSSGRVGIAEVQRILTAARSIGVDTLDTAAAYGSSEEVLGHVGSEGFKVISKLPPREAQNCIVSAWVTASVESSLTKLNQKSLYGFLLHRPLELLSAEGAEIYETLKDLKNQGLIQKLGVSVSGPEDLEKLSPYYKFDLVQAPMNLVDQRMLESGWLRQLKRQCTEVHIRSAFLQGLLLMPAQDRPSYFERWSDLFDRFDNWLKAEKLTALEACLGFLNQQEDVDKIVVGVDTMDQLISIADVADTNISGIPVALQSADTALINPALWTS